MRFWNVRYRDAFNVMQVSLESAGWERATKPDQADIVFIDREPTGNPEKWNNINRLAEKKPVFIYPHTPYAFWLWDGYTVASKNISCNFVTCEAALLSMQEYGYPCRVENVGFTRPLSIKEFKPTSGKHLAYSGPRLLSKNGIWYHEIDREIHELTMEWLTNNRKFFEKVTIFYSFDFDRYDLRPWENKDFEFVCVAKDGDETRNLNTASALRQLQGIDIFIGTNTLGYIALSQGIPTILVGHNSKFGKHSTNFSEHYSDYEKWCAFPLDLHQMSANEVLELCIKSNEDVEIWKKFNIGSDFDSQRFLRIVREFI